jgi:hypothetical protein
VRLGADLVSYSFIVSDLHRLLIAGPPAHCEDSGHFPARLKADCPSGNAPTTCVRRLISRRMRSNVLLVRVRSQCSSGKPASPRLRFGDLGDETISTIWRRVGPQQAAGQ